ncbi:PIN domain-containing protein [Chelativorans xinjiangense]|uniref:PIN domain-containing protein n=1 Tax=Chelativorans xinjiangense TaxID=2681485 RepID=UPI00135CA8B0|nr:PIN domain-containing protein [Chelativorans xinjiangense]
MLGRADKSPSAFIDTNVILYLASDDRQKAQRAEDIVGRGGVISIQVLNEIANAGRRKMRLSWDEVQLFIESVRGLLQVEDLTLRIHQNGLELAQRYGLSVYDGLIVASALDSGCSVLWSEDMQDGLHVEGLLRVTNPFRGL